MVRGSAVRARAKTRGPGRAKAEEKVKARVKVREEVKVMASRFVATCMGRSVFRPALVFPVRV